MSYTKIKKELEELSDRKNAKIFKQFFKTGKGEYGENDVFIGVTVPEQRKLVKKYSQLSLSYIKKLLCSGIHEERGVALLILIKQFKKENKKVRKKLFQFYLKHIQFVNNWDLVDTSAPSLVGEYLLHKKKTLLYTLAKSKNIWQRRVAIISTLQFIKNNNYKDTLKIAKILLKDKHDLIHKAVGWMLREIGKRSPSIEKRFLDKYSMKMPRTMLRYAVEKFSYATRKKFLNKM